MEDKIVHLKEVVIRVAQKQMLARGEGKVGAGKVCLWCEAFSDLSQEVILAVCLNGNLDLIGIWPVAVGSAIQASFFASDFFRAVLLSGASSAVFVHNHPSGDLDWSKEDIEVSKKLIAAGQTLDLPLQDCVILTKENGKVKHRSLRNEELVSFTS